MNGPKLFKKLWENITDCSKKKKENIWAMLSVYQSVASVTWDFLSTLSEAHLYNFALQDLTRKNFFRLKKTLKISGFVWVVQRNRMRQREIMRKRAGRNKRHSSSPLPLPAPTVMRVCSWVCWTGEWLVYGQINCFYGLFSPRERCWVF